MAIWGQMMRTSGLARGLAAIFVAIVFGSQSLAWAQTEVRLRPGNSKYAGSFELPLNKSRVLNIESGFVDILIGNPAIADALPLTDRTLYVLGKTIGSTTVSIFGRNSDTKVLLAVLDLVVTHDLDGIKRRYYELMPAQRIQVRSAHDAIILSGTVSSATHVANALAIAERYAPGKVTNMLRVR